jgi:hypothetical protein
MTKTLLEKMFLKPEYIVAMLHLPERLETELAPGQGAHTSLIDKYNFVLGFYSQEIELEKEIVELKKSLLPNGLLWIAYPKNKALETDLNRDKLHRFMKQHNLDGVSIVSLNDTWSAMRFKLL